MTGVSDAAGLAAPAFVDGVACAGDGTTTLEVEDPATGEVIARLAEAGPGLVDTAARSARAAYEGAWGALGAAERGRVLARSPRR